MKPSLRSKRFRGVFFAKKTISEVLDARKMEQERKMEDHYARVQKYRKRLCSSKLHGKTTETLADDNFLRRQLSYTLGKRHLQIAEIDAGYGDGNKLTDGRFPW